MNFSSREEIVHLIDEILYQLKRCEESHNAYLCIRNASLSEYGIILTKANNFFAITWQALIDNAVTEIIKVYDIDQNSFSFPTFINGYNIYIHKNGTFIIDNDLIEIISKGMEFLKRSDIEKILYNLRMRRNKHYMHNDIDYYFDLNKLREKFPFNFTDMELLIHGAKTTCLNLYSYFTHKEWQPGIHQGKLWEKPRDPQDLYHLLDLCKNNNNL